MGDVERIRQEEVSTNNLVSFMNKKNKKDGKEVKLKKDGTAKQTYKTHKEGEAHTVYPIKSKEEIKAIQQYFIDKKNNSELPEKKQIASRNLMMWTIGINVGLRASDLRNLTWGDVFYKDGTFKDGVRIQEKKTSKYKTFYFNKYATDAITEYVNEYNPCLDEELHVFRSRQGGAIEVRTIYNIVDEATKACGINKNCGSHTMRKTFGYHFYTSHKNDMDALVHLQRLFSHASPQITLAYIGIEDEESKKFYNDLSWD